MEMEKKANKVTDDDELHKLLVALGENMYWENLDWEMFMKRKNEIAP
jgi:hypothetical protein